MTEVKVVTKRFSNRPNKTKADMDLILEESVIVDDSLILASTEEVKFKENQII
jgi:hypothetical protein